MKYDLTTQMYCYNNAYDLTAKNKRRKMGRILKEIVLIHNRLIGFKTDIEPNDKYMKH